MSNQRYQILADRAGGTVILCQTDDLSYAQCAYATESRIAREFHTGDTNVRLVEVK